MTTAGAGAASPAGAAALRGVRQGGRPPGGGGGVEGLRMAPGRLVVVAGQDGPGDAPQRRSDIELLIELEDACAGGGGRGSGEAPQSKQQ
jgi:hypothetical protein